MKAYSQKKFCCKYLTAILNNPDAPIEYIAKTREFILTIPKSYLRKGEGCDSFDIQFCPRCGTKLATDLTAEWERILEEEYGIHDPYISSEDKKRIPQDFLTDEWWKKRGL